MAEYSLTIPTPVEAGSAIPFNNTIIKGCCNVRHREGSGNIRLRGGSCCHPNRYHIMFHGNITGVTATAQLGIYLDGELLPETLMSVVEASPDNVLSVDSTTEVEVVGCYSTVSVRIIAGTNAVMNTANIIVHKEAS